MKRFFAALAVLSICCSALAIKPEDFQNRPASSLIFHQGRALKICDDPEERVCRTSLMPEEVGNVVRVVHGNFVSHAIAKRSWLALTITHASMCYLAVADDAVTCVPVGAALPAGVEITFEDIGDKMPLLKFVPEDASIPMDIETHRDIRTFTRALSDSKADLQTKAFKTSDPQANRANPGAMADHGDDDTPCISDQGECNGDNPRGPGNDPGEPWWKSEEGEAWAGQLVPQDANEGWGQWAYGREPKEDRANNEFPPMKHVFPEPIVIEQPIAVLPPELHVASMPLPCVYGPLVAYCLSPSPTSPHVIPPPTVPPVQPVEPKPRIPNLSLCELFGMFCSSSDILNNEPDHNSSLDDWYDWCYAKYESDMDECAAYGAASDYRTDLAPV